MGKKTLKGLLKCFNNEELRLIAGAKGLSRELKWISTVEDVDLMEFSGQAYLNFITGHKMSDERKIFDMVASAYFHNLAGIVFAPGRESGAYIEMIPQSVIDFADEHDFPLFVIDWETKISDMTKSVCSYILLDDSQLGNLADLLRSIIMERIELPLRDEEKETLSHHLFFEHSTYQVTYLSIGGDMVENEKSSVLHKLIADYRGQGTIILLEDGIAFVYKDEDATELCTYDEHVAVADNFKSISGDRFHIRMGSGNRLQGYEGLVQSYRQAVLVAGLDDGGFYSGKRIFKYEDAGLYKDLWELSDHKAFIRFSEETLGPLLKYDESNGTDLYNCLETYIRSGCSTKRTSELLFVHKNTVSYKIKKIESILGGELSDRRLMLDLQIAIIIKYAFLC